MSLVSDTTPSRLQDLDKFKNYNLVSACLLKLRLLFFEGTKCEIGADECASHPCKNGATCIDQPGNCFCHCVAPFKGNDHQGRRTSKHS